MSHLPNWKNGSLVNDGKLGEQLSLQTLNEKTGLDFKPLQNSSNHGCDGNDRDGDTGGYYLYLKKSDIENFDYWFEHEAELHAQLVDFEVEWIG
ncbi:hypothetical protein [Pseudomonas sp. CFBP 8772]|uniref:hypothetical protein n=1 Tax=Pseudomonas sp. CFBP 8772 TaxID=2775284 RepID=UPI0012073E7B|nr:hypothetical protein [Pseudomonas sp. CFBP 8772]MBD8596795.1 hypothetical protein [Pseudomonas sp. CFBP 8772]RZI59963.1 MAG: hypothetical protein EOP14_03110 [Pseudomonas sp.]